MSHFVGLCFGDNWENDLEYYYEGLEVEPYEDDGQMITYNPNSKWDWYSIGGRWSGFLPLKELDSEGNRLTTNEAFVKRDWEVQSPGIPIEPLTLLYKFKSMG